MGHSTRRLMMGAAGAGGDPTYVEDVFSTYLWRGDGNSGRPIINGIKLGNANSGTSVLFDDNVNDYLEIAHTTDLCVGSGDFTIECWAYHIGDFGSFDGLFGNWTGSGDNGYILETVGSGATTDLEFYYYPDGGGSYVGPVQGGTVSSNQWNHLCVCRSGNTIRLFVNGTMHGSGTSITTGIRNGTSNFTIGGQVAGGGWWNGYITDLRVTKGQALYTSNFTPSTDPLTTTSQGATASNVKLLCCNKDTATGSTKTPGTITAHGETHIKSFGPFTGTDGEGGLVWMKSRTTGNVNVLFDTERGANQRLRSDSDLSQNNVDLLQPSFTNSGFTVGSGNEVNGSGNDYTSWTFRKQKGFFDIVTYTGTGVTQNIAHNLGSVPGAIFVKRTDASHNWGVYHRGLNNGVTPERYRERLNIAGQEDGNNNNGASYWANTAPTSTHFTVSGPQGGYINTNISGATYVAYIFAGGKSTAATAPSVSFDGSNAYLQVPSSSDFAYGTGDFTWECWAKSDSNPAERILISNGTDYGYIGIYSQSGRTSVQYVGKATSPHIMSDGFSVARNQWFHVAVSRNSGTTRLFLNGRLVGSASDTNNYSAGVVDIGRSSTSPHNYWNGYISNVRIVKGTGLYSSSFTPSTEPLKNVSGTVLLCCNNSSVTGATVTPGTITAHSSPTASTDTPFDDPEGYKFGEEGGQNIIKCGQLTTDTTNGSYLNLPWEPQWIIYKHVSANSNWHMLDCMRGWTSDGTVQILSPNLNNAESGGGGYEELKSRTIKFQGYGNNYDFIYMAIRRPDGYVGKPAEAGTDVFAMDTGNSSSTIPNFDSGFPVGFAFMKTPASSGDWYTGARLLGERYVRTNSSNGDADWGGGFDWDSNVGWLQSSAVSAWQSWMWKRHAGFDVVTYKGDGVAGRQIPHSLNKIPEMMWVKSRDSSGNDAGWQVYHSGLGPDDNDPQGWNLQLNTAQAQNWNNFGRWNKTVPTSTYFTLGNYDGVNKNGDDMIAMLFASVDGISKVGYYAGSDSEQTISCGFQPRFAIIRNISMTEDWGVYDTLRGWSSGNDKYLKLNDTPAQSTYDFGQPTSTGFTLVGNNTAINKAGNNFIFYAHA